MGTIEINGTGGILEGDLGAAIINVNTDAVLDFDGTDDKITIGDLSTVTTWSVSCWAKHTGTNEDTIWDGNFGSSTFPFLTANNANLYFYYDNGSGSPTNTNSNFAVDMSVWNHILVTYDHSATDNLKMYVNGVLKNPACDANGSSTPPVDMGAFTIGGGNSYGSWNGSIVDFRFYNTALTVTEAQILASRIGIDNSIVQTSDTRIGHWMLNVKNSGSLLNEGSNIGATGDVTFTVDDGTDFIDNDYQHILIDNEVMKVEAISSNDITVDGSSNRTAQCGTTVAAHNNDTPIYIIGLEDLSSNNVAPVLAGDLTTPSGDLVFDAFSVNVQDTMTTTGTTTVTQGKLEGLSLTSVLCDGNDNFVDLNTALQADIRGGFTMSVWAKANDGVDGNQALFGAYKENDNNILGYIDSAGQFSALFAADGNPEYAVEDGASFPNGATPWTHITLTVERVDATNATMKIYANGVERPLTGGSPGTFSGSDIDDFASDVDMTVGKYNKAGAEYYLAGKLRDFRCYDYALSADQAASLYSGSYNVTPSHWWKLDDSISGTSTPTAVDSGTGTASNGTLTNFDATTGLDADSDWSNGTLNLDSSLTIAATGSLSAPRGTLSIGYGHASNKALDINCTNVDITSAGNQFIHNNGKFLFDSTSGDQLFYAGGATFFNLDSDNSSSGLNIREDVTILGTLDCVDASANITFNSDNAAGNITITMGNDDNQATIDNDTANRIAIRTDASKSVTIQGGSILKPCLVVGQDWEWNSRTGSSGGTYGAGVKLANMDFSAVSTVSIDSSATYRQNVELTGDCKFAALTIPEYTKLDLDGERIHTTGNVDINGSLIMGAGMWHAEADFDTSNAAVTEEAGATLLCEGINYIHNNDGSFIGDATTNILLQGSNFTYLNSSDANVSTYVGNLIVGSGTATLHGPARGGEHKSKANNITVATGGTLTPTNAVDKSHEITCLGDFTTSGGLLGASCLTFDGTNDIASIPDNAAISGLSLMTVEAWAKFDSDSGTNYRYICRKESEYQLGIQNDGTFYGFIRDAGGTERNILGTVDLRDAKWHHYAMVWNGTKAIGYLDGKKIGETSGNTAAVNNTAYVLTVGGRNADSSPSEFMKGCIDELRIWNDVRSTDEIRAGMFTQYGSGEGGLVGYWKMDTGTGTTEADSSSNSNVLTFGATSGGANPPSWAGAGDFTKGTSTLVMAKAGTQVINYLDGEDVQNLTINDGSTTQLFCPTGTVIDSGDLDVHGTLIVNEKLMSHASANRTAITMKSAGTITVGSDVRTTAMADLYALLVDVGGSHSNTLIIEESTHARIFCKDSTTKATGDLTITVELEVSSGAEFNANGNTINPIIVDIKNGGTLNLSNSTLNFYSGAGDSWSMGETSTLTTGNTTVTGANSGTPAGTPIYLPLANASSSNFEIVGDVDLLVTYGETDLTVIGSVTNCKTNSAGSIIRQWHHTLDTQQLLDADSGADDDLRLTKPALDNSHELQTG